MYTIYMDGVRIYAPNLRDKRYSLINPILKGEVNLADRLTFSIPKANVGYSNLHLLKSNVTVYDDYDVIFHGRLLSAGRDWYNTRSCTCEGALGWLNDSIIPPHTFSGTYQDYLQYILDLHNSQVDSDRQLLAGTQYRVSSGEFAETEYRTAMEILQGEQYLTAAQREAGARIQARSQPQAATYGPIDTYIDTITRDLVNGNQPVQFGRNLLDFEEFLDATEVFTRIIPLGPRDTGTGEYMTIASVNGGSIYLEDSTAAGIYGRITKTVSFPDVETEADLLAAGAEALAQNLSEALTLDLTAMDLSLLGYDYNTFQVGSPSPIIDVPHGYDDVYHQCRRRELHLAEPDKSRYIFGVSRRPLTRRTVDEVRANAQAISKSTSMGSGSFAFEDSRMLVSPQANYTGTKVTVTDQERNAIVYTIYKEMGADDNGSDANGCILVAQELRDGYLYWDPSKAQESWTMSWQNLITHHYRADYWSVGVGIDPTESQYALAYQAYLNVFVRGGSGIRHRIFAHMAASQSSVSSYAYRVMYYVPKIGWDTCFWGNTIFDS